MLSFIILAIVKIKEAIEDRRSRKAVPVSTSSGSASWKLIERSDPKGTYINPDLFKKGWTGKYNDVW